VVGGVAVGVPAAGGAAGEGAGLAGAGEVAGAPGVPGAAPAGGGVVGVPASGGVPCAAAEPAKTVLNATDDNNADNEVEYRRGQPDEPDIIDLPEKSEVRVRCTLPSPRAVQPRGTVDLRRAGGKKR
jgi:hypothetical protein